MWPNDQDIPRELSVLGLQKSLKWLLWERTCQRMLNNQKALLGSPGVEVPQAAQWNKVKTDASIICVCPNMEHPKVHFTIIIPHVWINPYLFTYPGNSCGTTCISGFGFRWSDMGVLHLMHSPLSWCHEDRKPYSFAGLDTIRADGVEAQQADGRMANLGDPTASRRDRRGHGTRNIRISSYIIVSELDFAVTYSLISSKNHPFIDRIFPYEPA